MRIPRTKSDDYWIERGTAGLRGTLVIVAVLFLAVSSAAAGTPGLVSYADTTAETTPMAIDETAPMATNGTTNDTAVDVVFLIDHSESMDTKRYDLAQELSDFDERVEADGYDIQYALMTYGEDTQRRQDLTSDYAEIDDALDFNTMGTRENASDAILKSMDLYRDGSDRILVLVTNEDDDSSNATREQAIDELSDVSFLAVSPADAIDSSCQFHSAPCDNEEYNELRTVQEKAGGSWVDVENDEAAIVDEMDTTVGTTPGNDGSDSSGGTSSGSYVVSTSSPDIDPINGSINRSTVEIGESFEVSVVLENDGTADGTADAELSTENFTVASPTIDVPEGETVTYSLNQTYDEPGTYTFFYDHMKVGTVEVTPLRDTVVNLSVPEADRVTATITDARANTPVRIPLTHPDANGTLFGPATAVWVTPTTDADLTVSATATGSPDDERPFTEHVRTLSYVSIDTTLDANRTESVHVEYAGADDVIETYGLETDTTASENVSVDPENTSGDPASNTTDSMNNSTVDANNSTAATNQSTWIRYNAQPLSTVERNTSNVSDNASSPRAQTTVRYDIVTVETDENVTVSDGNETNATGTDGESMTNETSNETTVNADGNESDTGSWDARESLTVVDRVWVSPTENLSEVTLAWEGDESQRRLVSTSDGTSVAFGERVPGFEVDALTLDASSVDPGETVVATVAVDNDGLVDGTYKATVTANGEPVAETSIFVPANGSRDVQLSFVPDESGEYAVDVNGAASTTLVVNQPATTEATTTTTADATETASPGLGIVAAVVALLGAILLKTRR